MCHHQMDMNPNFFHINDKHNRRLDVLAFNTDLLVAVWARFLK